MVLMEYHSALMFLNLFISAEFFIKLKIYKLLTIRFESQILKFEDLKLRQYKHIGLFDDLEKNDFIIIYNHYLPKISE
jgi:hypothetical protein